jgi:uridine kinase
MTSVFVIGIAGGTGSGKSTLATALTVHLGQQNCVLLPMDDFYKQQPDEVLASGTGNFECPEAFDFESFVTAVESLRESRETVVPEYDRKTSRIQGSKILKPRTVLIVEGLFVLFDERLRECLDLALFLEVDAAVRLSRRLERDVGEYGLSFERVHHEYERNIVPAYSEFVAPTKASADLVLSGTSSIDDLVAHVVAHLRGNLALRHMTEAWLPISRQVS